VVTAGDEIWENQGQATSRKGRARLKLSFLAGHLKRRKSGNELEGQNPDESVTSMARTQLNAASDRKKKFNERKN